MISEATIPKNVFRLPLLPADVKCLERFIRSAPSGDPALIIQFQPDGIVDREQRFDLVDAADLIRNFLEQHGLTREANSEIIFYHASLGFVLGVLHELMHELDWCRHHDGHPDVGYAYIMLTERRRPDTSWLRFVFNPL
jgi:hypothetical protein